MDVHISNFCPYFVHPRKFSSLPKPLDLCDNIIVTKSLIYIAMKNTIRKSFGTILLVAAFASAGFAQDYLKMESSKNFMFKLESSASTVLVNVTSEYNYLKIHVEGYVEVGEILCEIIDPAGEVKRTFNLISNDEVNKGQNTGYSSIVKGEMEKAFRTPASGKWEVRVTPKNAKGMLEITHVLIWHPKADVLELYQIEAETRSTGK
jgi:hypothetical protein